jgi:hypothetical protein
MDWLILNKWSFVLRGSLSVEYKLSPRNENLNLLVRIKFLNLLHIYVLIKTVKFTVPNKVLLVLEPEDKCSSWGLQVWMYVNKLTFLYTCTSLSWHLDKHNHSHSHLAISDPVCTGFPCKHKHLWTQIFYTNFIQQEI